MNEENMRKWVEALRSGRYERGHSKLRNFDERFCCLGVACDVSGLGRWESVPPSGDLYSYVVGESRSASRLPVPVMEWLGLSSVDPSFDVGNDPEFALHEVDEGMRIVSASVLNDAYELSFERIADIIEENMR